MARRQIGVTIESMTGSPHGVTPGGSWPPSGPPPTWPPTPPKQSRAPVIASLVIAIVAVAVAIAAWFRPANADTQPVLDPTPQYSEQDTAAAKSQMCDAYSKAAKAIAGAGSQDSDDPSLKYGMVVNSRLAFHVMTDYFRYQLTQNPAAPPALSDQFYALISAYDDMVLTQLANASPEELDRVYARTEAADSAVVDSCK
ncbi:hypothetical protein BH11ACT6_BH11ACT6_37920 [soil metagenome]